jgi:hypothetical protein
MQWQVGVELLLLEQQRAERIGFVLPGVDPETVDLDDEDGFTEVVAQAHGPIHQEGLDEEIHLLLHSIVARRLILDEPRGIWDRAQRLVRSGHGREGAVHHLVSEVGAEISAALR